MARPIHVNLDENEALLRSIYTDSADVVFRRFAIGGGTSALLIYIDGLTNIEELDRSVLTPLMLQPADPPAGPSGEPWARQPQQAEPQSGEQPVKPPSGPPETPDRLSNLRIPVSGAKQVDDIAGVVQEVSVGGAVLLIDGQSVGIAFNLSKWEKRSPDEPKAETVIRGPREGFTETIADNTAMLRRKIRSPQLKMRALEIGRFSRTRVIVSYIENLADAALVEEVTNRLNRIDIGGILESGYIEELIEDNPRSPFPQVLSTERPDAAAAGLLEGRVVLLVDGTPFALVAPATLFSMLQSAEDYYQRFWISTAIRWLRYLFFLISLLLPSVYVAVLTYHQEMLPTPLLLSVARSREEVPFPALIEALLMEITFEALREAGLRLPKQVGTAVSIVGALVIGEAAVSAGLVSAPMVMVVSLTGIASFTIPRYSAGFAFRMMRFTIIILAGTLGLLGIMLCVIAIIVHMSKLRSFGVPYLTPLSPAKGSEMRDVFIRAPWWMMGTRPQPAGAINPHRQSGDRRPGPEPDGGQG